ncbi:MAG: hypothetical protein KY459_05715 [Acidobacteria bacterium]|nr:hypothetical protein [Acidobacteriota bacterium]
MSSCDEIQNAITDAFVEGEELDATLSRHIRSCPVCVEEYAVMQEIWQNLPAIDERKLGGGDGTVRAFPRRVPKKIAMALAAVVLFGAGIATGMLILRDSDSPGDQARLEEKVDSLNELVVLSLLEQSSASARLEAIGRIAGMEEPSPALAAGLIEAAVSDENPNVRLAAVEAARPLVARPGVYRELADRLALESAPLVQIALIDVLLEQPTAEPSDIESLIDREDIEDEVRSFARQRAGERI